MANSLTELNQSKSVAVVSPQQAPVAPPKPPPAAIIESLTVARMRRSTAQQGDDGFVSNFAPWASAPSAKPAQDAGTKPPMFMMPVETNKVEKLRNVIGIITGRVKAASKELSEVAMLLGVTDENDPLARATRIRKSISSSLSFGERATQVSSKVRDSGAQVLLRITPEGTQRAIELTVSVLRLGPEKGRSTSFIEVTGTAPLADRGEVELVDQLRERLHIAWGRKH